MNQVISNSTTSPFSPVLPILSEAERHCVLVYHLLIAISSLLGDTIILISSLKYKAIKLHEFIVGLIEHIAACDLLLNFSYVIPGAISLAAEGWVFGHLLLCIRIYITWYSFSASLFLICALTSSKLLLLKRPLQSRSLTRKTAHSVCAVIWVISGYMPALFFIIDKDDVEFDTVTCYGEYQYRAPAWEWLVPLSSILVAVIPNTVVIVTTICIIRYLLEARRAAKLCGGKVKWHGIMTVVVTAVVCCASSIPMALFFVTEKHSLLTGPQVVYFEIVARYLTLLNVMSNFFIYCVTVPSFRKFLKAILCVVLCPNKIQDSTIDPNRRAVLHLTDDTAERGRTTS